MQLGMFAMPLHPPARPLADTLEEDRQAVLLADRLGFSEAWFGEHFSSTAEPIASPLAFFSSLVHQTRQIKFATGVLNLPQSHPAMVAAQVAQFDHLSRGRYLLGIGPGGLGSDFELLGIGDKETRSEMMLESIEAMQRIWAQDAPYSIPGKYWNVNITDFRFDGLGIGEMPKPYQQPHPQICLSIITPRSPSARMAGTRGWHPVSANFIQPRYIRSHWEAYAEGVESIGAAARPGKLAHRAVDSRDRQRLRGRRASLQPGLRAAFLFPLLQTHVPEPGLDGDAETRRQHDRRGNHGRGGGPIDGHLGIARNGPRRAR